jgi:hypothetical protein
MAPQATQTMLCPRPQASLVGRAAHSVANLDVLLLAGRQLAKIGCAATPS